MRIGLGALRQLVREVRRSSKQELREFLGVLETSISDYINSEYSSILGSTYPEELAEQEAAQFINDHWDECAQWAASLFSSEVPPKDLDGFKDIWQQISEPLDRLEAVIRAKYEHALTQYEKEGINVHDPSVKAMQAKHRNRWFPVDRTSRYEPDPDDEADAKDFNARIKQEYGPTWSSIKRGDTIRFSPIVSVESAIVSAIAGAPDMVIGKVKNVSQGFIIFEEPVMVPAHSLGAPPGERSQEESGFRFSSPWQGPVSIESWLYDTNLTDDEPSSALVARMQKIVNRLRGDEALQDEVARKIETFHSVEVIEQGPEEAAVIKGFKKAELIAYTILVLGPMGREPILKVVDALEGKPHNPGSNVSYFIGQNPGPYGKPGIVDDVIVKSGKGPKGAILYDLTDKGRSMAQKVLDRLSKFPALRATEASK